MPDLKQAWAFLENSDGVASAGEVQAAIRRVATEIEQRLAGTYPMVLAVMGGAVVFAGQLLPLLRFPLDFDYIHASRYGAATRGAGVDWTAQVSRSASRFRSMSLPAGAHFTNHRSGPVPIWKVRPPSSFCHTARTGRPAASF